MLKLKLFVVWLTAIIFIFFKRKRLITISTLTSAFIIVVMFKWSIICSTVQPQLHIRNICQQHATGSSVGSLCDVLCRDQHLSSISCQTFYMGKESVFSAIMNNNSIVFKSPKISSSITEVIRQWFENNESPSESEFTNMIKMNIKYQFNIDISDINVKKMTSYRNGQSYDRRIEMENLWSLLNDNEYLALILYEKSDIFPKLIGNCGTTYAVEGMTTVSGYWHLITMYDSEQDWKKRVKIALKILEFLKVIHHSLPEPLYLCDLKMSHFGLTNDFKKVKYLDLDLVHPHSIVNKITANGSPCKDHSDCDFFDCRSFCNLRTRKCEFGVVNNNLQIVCEKVFLGWLVPGRVMVPGLLLGRHTPAFLLELLEKCANPSSETGIPRSAAPLDIQKRLFQTLTHLSL